MNAEWTRVKWSQARQVTEILEWKDEDVQGDPAAFYAGLRRTDRLMEAVEFMAQALPRWEAVAWAVDGVRGLTPNSDPANAAALDAASRWVSDPTEDTRRQAFAAAETSPHDSAERLLALAAFLSGGSIAPLDCEPLPAPRAAAGQCAAGALLIAAATLPEPEIALARILDVAERLAAGQALDGAP